MTVEELEQMPEEEEPGRYDLIDGELFKMPPPGEEHGDCTVNVLVALTAVVRRRGIGKRTPIRDSCLAEPRSGGISRCGIRPT